MSNERLATEVMGWRLIPAVIRVPNHADDDAYYVNHKSSIRFVINHDRWQPDKDIAQAMMCHRQFIKNSRFSVRLLYYRYLQEVVTGRVAPPDAEYLIDWPDVLNFIEPQDFCAAILQTLPEKT